MQNKVLISLANIRKGNGIASCIMNYYDGLLEAGIDVDFLIQRDVSSPYMDYVKERGSSVFVLPHATSKPNRENVAFINDVVVRGRYNIIHNNLNGWIGVELLSDGNRCGVPIRIHHSHNPKETSSIKAYVRSCVFDALLLRYSNVYFACSSKASEVFGRRKYIIIRNAIDAPQYRFDCVFRNVKKKELGIQDKCVVGTVCRHAEQKNPYFILDVFAEVLRKEENAVLLWAGTGPLTENVKEYSGKLGISGSVKFLGDCTNVNKIYSLMDVFFLPSFFEGLGMTFIEAQASGLYCIASDKVPNDTNIYGRIEYISLKKDKGYWADRIVTALRHDYKRGDYSPQLRDKHYDITAEKKALADAYLSLTSSRAIEEERRKR